MDATARHRLILDLLRERGRVEVPDLAARSRTSAITVRRDLDVLAGLGALRRVRGGAVPPALRGEGLPFDVRAADGAPLKARLAAAVADLVADGEAVVVDSGTTGAAAAAALARRRVTVMPLSVQGIAALAGSPTVELLLPGGSVRRSEGSLVGPLAERALAELRFDTAVLTCCGAAGDARSSSPRGRSSTAPPWPWSAAWRRSTCSSPTPPPPRRSSPGSRPRACGWRSSPPSPA